MESNSPIPQTNYSLDSQAIFAALRDVLAELYPVEQDARLVVDDAGLMAIHITVSARAQTNWHHILVAARDQGRLDALLAVVRKTYPHHQPLVAAYVNYQHLLDQGGRLDATAQLTDDEARSTAHVRLAQLPVDMIPPLAPLPPGSHMPFRVNPLFVGREAELMKLAMALKGGKTVAVGQIAAATGLGGIGKTQLAVVFVHHYGQYFTGGSYWLNFTDPNAIPTEIANCGSTMPDIRADFATLDLETRVRLVLAAWQNPLPRLLVFDNCDEPALLEQWRPITGGSRVLVTSRRQIWDAALGVFVVTLDTLARSQSIELLRKFRPELSATDPLLDQIADGLDDLPLALHLAGSYLARYRHVVSPAQYLAQLRQSDLLQHRSLQAGDLSPTGHVQHVARTFALSYERLHPDDPVDALARTLLVRAAWFAPGQLIPRTLLLAMLESNEEDALQAADALQRLVNLGLLDSEPAGDVLMHSLVMHFVQRTDTVLAQAAQSAVAATLLKEASRINNTGVPGPLLAWQSHLRHITDTVKGQTDEQAAALCSTLGFHLRMFGDFVTAKPYLERALAIHKAVLGDQHPDTAQSYNNLGRLLRDMGELSAAKPYLERALANRRVVLGDQHPSTAQSYNDLGVLLRVRGELSAPIPYFERALAIRQSALGDQHPTTAQSYSNLGLLLKDMGKLSAAKAYFEQALAIFEAVLGKQHPDTALSYNNLGMMLRDMGELSAAKPYLEQALAIFEAVLGKQHSDTALSYNNLGLLLRDMGELPTAKLYLERALVIRQAVLGDQHRYTAQSYNSLGLLLRDMGELPAAKLYIERALVIRQAVLGDQHPNTAQSYNNLGMMLRDMGELSAAKPYLEQALAIHEAVLGKQHPDTALSYNNLGLLLKDMGESPIAKSYLERALAICQAVLGNQHPNISTIYNNLGMLLKETGELSAAKLYLERALAIRQAVLGDQHFSTAQSYDNLSILLKEMGQLSAARPSPEQALAIYEKSLYQPIYPRKLYGEILPLYSEV